MKLRNQVLLIWIPFMLGFPALFYSLIFYAMSESFYASVYGILFVFVLLSLFIGFKFKKLLFSIPLLFLMSMLIILFMSITIPGEPMFIMMLIINTFLILYFYYIVRKINKKVI